MNLVNENLEKGTEILFFLNRSRFQAAKGTLQKAFACSWRERKSTVRGTVIFEFALKLAVELLLILFRSYLPKVTLWGTSL
jgi:hypothetical protein